jgi:hypothetical protein
VDESTFQQQLTEYYNGAQPANRLWLILAKIIICAGAASLPEQEQEGSDIKRLRDTLYSEVLSAVHITYMSMRVSSLQVLFITVRLGVEYCRQYA